MRGWNRGEGFAFPHKAADAVDGRVFPHKATDAGLE